MKIYCFFQTSLLKVLIYFFACFKNANKCLLKSYVLDILKESCYYVLKQDSNNNSQLAKSGPSPIKKRKKIGSPPCFSFHDLYMAVFILAWQSWQRPHSPQTKYFLFVLYQRLFSDPLLKGYAVAGAIGQKHINMVRVIGGEMLGWPAKPCGAKEVRLWWWAKQSDWRERKSLTIKEPCGRKPTATKQWPQVVSEPCLVDGSQSGQTVYKSHGTPWQKETWKGARITL